MKKSSKLDPFKAFEAKNFKSIVGGAETYQWREGSSFQYMNMSTDDDEELVTTEGSSRYIDGAYDCGEGKVAF